MRARATAFDEALADAAARGFLGTLPPEAREALLADAVRLDLPSGAIAYREGEPRRVGLVVTGLVRAYVTSPDGRQVTIRYGRPGDVLGIAATVGGPAAVNVQAVLDSTALLMNPATLQRLAQRDARVAWAVIEELTHLVYELWNEISGTAFASVRQRVARHLLELAVARRQDGGRLVAEVTQQELADAVGSVREVVARVLRQLREKKLVEVGPRGIVVLDPSGLASQAWPRLRPRLR